ncbi:hypothetical protein AYI69_g3101 [Smittium culicis]|uniref:Uncharacterized protein n=1 Tax=Smittium culicis TaxID=133412 RepID=A0A1R1YKR5_9FUNG|nr:hypothetical protein AYI69_g3101 [Smittium culicis]
MKISGLFGFTFANCAVVMSIYQLQASNQAVAVINQSGVTGTIKFTLKNDPSDQQVNQQNNQQNGQQSRHRGRPQNVPQSGQQSGQQGNPYNQNSRRPRPQTNIINVTKIDNSGGTTNIANPPNAAGILNTPGNYNQANIPLIGNINAIPNQAYPPAGSNSPNIVNIVNGPNYANEFGNYEYQTDQNTVQQAQRFKKRLVPPLTPITIEANLSGLDPTKLYRLDLFNGFFSYPQYNNNQNTGNTNGIVKNIPHVQNQNNIPYYPSRSRNNGNNSININSIASNSINVNNLGVNPAAKVTPLIATVVPTPTTTIRPTSNIATASIAGVNINDNRNPNVYNKRQTNGDGNSQYYKRARTCQSSLPYFDVFMLTSIMHGGGRRYTEFIGSLGDTDCGTDLNTTALCLMDTVVGLPKDMVIKPDANGNIIFASVMNYSNMNGITFYEGRSSDPLSILGMSISIVDTDDNELACARIQATN